MANHEDPYCVFTDEIDSVKKYYVSFTDGNGDFQKVEVNIEIYTALEESRKNEKRQTNFINRHVEHTELSEEELLMRAQPVHIDEFAKREQSELIRAAFLSLTKIQRRRFVLSHVYGMSYEDVAQLEGCRFQTVSRSIKAAKKMLTESLQIGG